VIRYANKFDINNICDLIRDFGKTHKGNCDFLKCDQEKSKDKVVAQLHNILAGTGFILIAEDYSGVLCAIKTPSLWIQNTYILQEVMWHGLNKKTSLRLLKKYLEIGEQMKQLGTVQDVYFSSYLDIDYQKLKVKKLSNHWVM
jgi:hypothetical protein